MCGVLGILGKMPLSMARELLLLLAHRGQDAAGLLWISGNEYIEAKAMGSPAFIELPDESPKIILGSTRYPTIGKRVGTEKDLDIFVGPFQAEQIALTHNGNITNMAVYAEKDYFTDAQFITDKLAKYLSENNNILPDAIRKLSSELDGAFSIVGIHEGKLFAFRDSRGFKPLVFGRSKDLTVIASESTVHSMIGIDVERDVYPGELLIFSQDGKLESFSISQNALHSHCFFEYVYFAHPATTIENQLVYDVRFRLGRALASAFKKMNIETPDYVVPVPDTSRPAAQALAEALDVPMREIILKNRYLGRTFIVRTQEERNAMAKSKYIYLTDKIRNKTILVVDDSIVRGTTAKMIVKDLKGLGASKVYFAATCPPQDHPCYYGIDISTGKELIASNSRKEEIRKYIGADALIYQDINDLVNAIGLKDLCLACLDGDYPTEHARYIQEQLQDEEESDSRDYERVIG
ncbi:MAG: Amidophosphoribosyltransferase [Candidatus Thorarchaeota archaeon]|nr:MAG: Amidophosphoribosyltransferase [Candidatus Thorarchaeota archaeon]